MLHLHMPISLFKAIISSSAILLRVPEQLLRPSFCTIILFCSECSSLGITIELDGAEKGLC
jgi:hypothetical protein